MFGFLRFARTPVSPMALTESDIRDCLAGLEASQYPSSIQIMDGGKVMVTFEVDPSLGTQLENMRYEAEQALSKLTGVKQVMVILTAERAPTETEPKKPAPRELSLPYIKKIIAVSSGKGGVGKSTVAANVAVAIAKTGLRVGLMDGDIYGPSVPRLFGMRDAKPTQDDDGNIIPFDVHGIKIMSMGFLVEESAPMIWRGPIVQSAITQLLRDVVWGDAQNPLDILVIDMPPGTGDAHLTLAQKVRLAGAVIVSTPQDLALIDARKGLEMYLKVGVPILGIVENMSYYCCPSCGNRDDVFGHGGARVEAEKLGVPFLGEVPLNGDIRAASDSGEMVPAFYGDIVQNILNGIESDTTKPFPKIIFD
jgi:ATP-binding protein involved in chromosome partitioning